MTSGVVDEHSVVGERSVAAVPEAHDMTAPEVTVGARGAIGSLGLGQAGVPLDVAKLATAKARALEVIRDHLRQEYDFEHDGFDEIRHDSATPINHIWIGDVRHVPVSDDPKLVATIFTEKIQKDGSQQAPKNHICLFISTEPLQKDDLINKYDESLEKELIAFTVEFDFDGPRRHSLKHRHVDPKFRGRLGTEILKEYEKYFQKMANDTGETQYNVILTRKKITLDWALKNGYKPDTEHDAELIVKLKAGGQGVTVKGEDLYLEEDPDKIVAPIGMAVRKDFTPVSQ